MLPFVLFVILTVASGVLLLEALSGRTEGPTSAATAFRAGLFVVATVAGASLCGALAGGEWVLFAALAPITLLCLVRGVQLVATVRRGRAVPVVLLGLVLVGTAACLAFLPRPLDREGLLAPLVERVQQSIRPGASGRVRA